ncbi:phytoene desaturase family protein [Lentisalinibacter orientalis]|uniref:phytoene desaturase family protein n=1 Tax=Lentisalinibacter orientalis TaxID=2992241 RepID=UPI0038696FD5
MASKRFDAIVVGAGMGGMCAAARLTAAGMKVLVIEKSQHIGGRCSHRQRGPYTVTTGAIMIPMGEKSAIREAFTAVGAEMEMVETTGRMRYRLGHGDYDLPETGGGLLGMLEFAFEGDSNKAGQLFAKFRNALADIPDDRSTFRDWLDSHTDNAAVKGLFQGFCAALMGTNLHEIPAGEFFRFLKYSSRGSRFGLAQHGNGTLMETLAAAIEARGAEIRRHTTCQAILSRDGRVTGAMLKTKGGPSETVDAEFVLSNTGPDRTIKLAGGRGQFDQGYLARLDAWPHEAPILHVSFVTNEPLIEGFDGSLVFGNCRNLIYLEIPSIISPELAPPGKFLHTAYGAPRHAAKTDLKKDLATTITELEANFPGQLGNAQFLVKARHSGQGPGMHRWAGRMMPVSTPIRNLYNVGDGATPPGTIGTEGAAASARAAFNEILV